MLAKFLTIILQIFSQTLYLSFSSETPMKQMLVHLMLSQRPLRLSSFHSFFFILLLSSYFHDSIFRLTHLFCFSYSIDSFWHIFHLSFCVVHYCLSFSSSQFSSVSQSCPILCDLMNRSTPGLPVHHQLPEFTQTHVHRVGDAIQPSHPLLSPSPPAPSPSQHQGLFQRVNSLVLPGPC